MHNRATYKATMAEQTHTHQINSPLTSPISTAPSRADSSFLSFKENDLKLNILNEIIAFHYNNNETGQTYISIRFPSLSKTLNPTDSRLNKQQCF